MPGCLSAAELRGQAGEKRRQEKNGGGEPVSLPRPMRGEVAAAAGSAFLRYKSEQMSDLVATLRAALGA